jgi:PadR family transcriptional regulator, regulatory protein PadR
MSYRTDTKALVLAVLQEHPLHGYGISRAIKHVSHDVLRLGEGQLYPILHSLEEEGWIVGQWEMQEGDPPRKVYAITGTGRAELEKRKQNWMNYANAVAAVLDPSTPLKAGGAHE